MNFNDFELSRFDKKYFRCSEETPDVVEEEALLEESQAFLGTEEEDDDDDAFTGRYIGLGFDNVDDRREGIMEALDNQRDDILIEDEELLESIKKFSKFDTEGSIDHLVEKNSEGTAVSAGILNDVLGLLYECQDGSRGNKKELDALVSRLETDILDEAYNWNYDAFLFEIYNREEGGAKNLDSWNSYFSLREDSGLDAGSGLNAPAGTNPSSPLGAPVGLDPTAKEFFVNGEPFKTVEEAIQAAQKAGPGALITNTLNQV
jgi:hypothetical protein